MSLIEEELKIFRTKKLQQRYSEYLDRLDEADREDSLESPAGEMQGRKVAKVESENSSIENLFNSRVKNN